MDRTTSNPIATSGSSNRPVYTIRYGVISAAIWRNLPDNGNATRPVYSVTFSRSYMRGDHWKDSTSFGLDDLLVLAKAADEAHSEIFRLRQQDAEATR